MLTVLASVLSVAPLAKLFVGGDERFLYADARGPLFLPAACSQAPTFASSFFTALGVRADLSRDSLL